MKKQVIRKRVVRKSAGRNAGNFISPMLQRKCEKCEEEDKKKVQRKSEGGVHGVASKTGGFIQSLPGSGSHMPAAQQQFFSKRMQHDFSEVKIHTGAEADASAKEMNALAYTTGNHIVFRQGTYNPNSPEGKKLLAHELAHVVQQQQGILRKEEPEMQETAVPTMGVGDEKMGNTRHYANCAGVNVQGHTDANYSHSFSHSGSQRKGSNCADCSGDECMVNTGTIVSVFRANPAVTLPSVPDGLSECEAKAVSTFINTTLSAHEQRHVAAFNTYNATIRTPYTYRGCASGLDAYAEGIHNGIESSRRASADAASAALDPFNPAIPCNCPDTESESASPESESQIL